MQTTTTDIGIMIHRITLGSVLLAHSVYLKAVVFTLPGTAAYFESLGLPFFSAHIVFIVEAIAGIALLIGYRVRLFAAIVVPVLLGATWAHLPNGWLFSNQGGGWEYPLVLTAMAISQALMGSGGMALAKRPRIGSAAITGATGD